MGVSAPFGFLCGLTVIYHRYLFVVVFVWRGDSVPYLAPMYGIPNNRIFLFRSHRIGNCFFVLYFGFQQDGVACFYFFDTSTLACIVSLALIVSFKVANSSAVPFQLVRDQDVFVSLKDTPNIDTRRSSC